MSRVGFGLLLLLAVLAALAVTILLTAPKVGAEERANEIRKYDEGVHLRAHPAAAS